MFTFWRDACESSTATGYQCLVFTLPEPPGTSLSKVDLAQHVSPYDIGRLELYASNMADYHLVVDLLPCLARLYFTGCFQAKPLHLSVVQKVSLKLVCWSACVISSVFVCHCLCVSVCHTLCLSLSHSLSLSLTLCLSLCLSLSLSVSLSHSLSLSLTLCLSLSLSVSLCLSVCVSFSLSLSLSLSVTLILTYYLYLIFVTSV